MFLIRRVVRFSSPRMIFIGEITFFENVLRSFKLNLFDLSKSSLSECSSSSVDDEDELRMFSSISSSSLSGEKAKEDLE